MNGTSSGFNAVDGVDHLDQRNAGTGVYNNTQFSTEPPDGALCVGAGFVVQAVNSALTVFDYSSNQLIAPVALNQFYKRSPSRDLVNAVYGDAVGDPQCVFDRDTQRFFVTVYYSAVNTTSSDFDFSQGTGILIAVSQTTNPLGGWHLYIQPTTNDGSGGTPNVSPNCPCFPDQPYVAVNAYAVTTSINLFSQDNSYVGPMVYVASKQALAAGATPILTAAFRPTQFNVPGTDIFHLRTSR